MYFANKKGEELQSDLYDWCKDYYDYIQRIQVLSIWRQSYRECYKALKHIGRIPYSGDKGEFRNLFVNQYRSYGQNIITSTTSIKPAWEPRATNSDFESIEQVQIAKSLLDYYMDQRKASKCLDNAASDAAYFGEGFVFTEWDPSMGKEVAPDDENIIQNEGDIKYTNFMPIDIITDPSLRNWEEKTWVILRRWVNKYELAAKYPAFEEEILAQQRDDTDLILAFANDYQQIYQAGDMIPVYEFYHEKTRACPDGRYAFFIKNQIINEGLLPTEQIYLSRICPIEMRNTRFGYSPMYDLLPLQKGLDILYSTIMTNQANFGVQNILSPRGANVNVSTLQGGLNFIQYDPMVGAPSAINFTQTSPEIFGFLPMIDKQMGLVAGVNETARGNPPPNVTSGVAIALQNASQDQYASYLKRGWQNAIADVGTNTIKLLQGFAKTERVMSIVGRDNRTYLKSFSGENISSIDRVIVDPGNPINSSIAGKMNLAETLIKSGYVQDPEQIVNVMTEGRIEPMFKSLKSELMNIRLENTRMMDLSENQPMVIKTDNHETHILEHKTVLDDPDMRSNPDVVNAVLSHIQEHENVAYDLMAKDPYLVGVLKRQVQMSMPHPPAPQGENDPSALSKTRLEGPPGTRKMNRVKNPVTGDILADD
jgi:hypothetical protein